MIEFLDVTGEETLTGETWCPGPVAGSVWVLLADGSAKAVKLATTAKPAQVVNRARGKYEAPYEWTVQYGDLTTRAQWSQLEARCAPALPRHAWQAALAPELRS